MAAQYKISRAFNRVNLCPSAKREIAGSIESIDNAYDYFDSKQITMIIQMLNHHWHKAIVNTEEEICFNGCVWDRRHKQLRDLTPPQIKTATPAKQGEGSQKN